MVNSTDLVDTDLSFDEFEHLAANIPKRPGATVFSLIEIDVWDDLDEMPSVYPEFRITHCCKGLFSSLSNVEDGMRSCISKNESVIYCFKIFELPFDSLSDLGDMNYPCSIREYLYGPKGDRLEQTICSSLRDDVGTKYGCYLGKPKSQQRFKKGDIVEVIGADTVSLAIVSHNPTDTHWCFDLYQRVKRDTEYRRYMLDASDDQVAVIDGPEYDNHSHTQLCDIMPTRFPLTEELMQRYKNYLVLSQTPH